MKLRITTFNMENLFSRYAFLDKPPEQQPKNYTNLIRITDVVSLEPGRSGGVRPAPITEAQRKNTAAAAIEAKPDVMAVCEVENITALRLFNAKYMRNYFDRCVLVDGNDPRGIDVGLLVRKGLSAEIRAIRSYADVATDGSILTTTNVLDMKNRLGKAAFSRDCLEIDIDVAGKQLTFLVNHFKAQEIKGNAADTTTDKRRRQADRAAKIAQHVKTRGRLPILLGDLNKDVSGLHYDGSLDPLMSSEIFVDPAKEAVPPNERWTHYYDSRRTVSQLDYVLVDQSLTAAIEQVSIFRGGLSPKCKQFMGPRVGTIGKDNLEASDHCPLSVDLSL
ncbi:hypothetical protein PO002_43180 [Cupriavidus necator]|uniref:endonuclease/exonuclease/phosphatase family protein n=1 Tax=Cupriavidus necator TaxID=106590 RepID=UPI0039C2D3B3